MGEGITRSFLCWLFLHSESLPPNCFFQQRSRGENIQMKNGEVALRGIWNRKRLMWGGINALFSHIALPFKTAVCQDCVFILFKTGKVPLRAFACNIAHHSQSLDLCFIISFKLYRLFKLKTAKVQYHILLGLVLDLCKSWAWYYASAMKAGKRSSDASFQRDMFPFAEMDIVSTYSKLFCSMR